jgi:nitrite reductase/ring-hydroxylating ferredoxin subunit
VAIYNRVCDHEGASLDAAKLSRECLVCPWHAKRVKPLAIVKLNPDGCQKLEVGPGYEVVIEEGRMTILGIS